MFDFWSDPSSTSILAWAFACRLCDKYHNLLSWLICWFVLPALVSFSFFLFLLVPVVGYGLWLWRSLGFYFYIKATNRPKSQVWPREGEWATATSGRFALLAMLVVENVELDSLVTHSNKVVTDTTTELFGKEHRKNTHCVTPEIAEPPITIRK